jgi:hypothetical protein
MKKLILICTAIFLANFSYLYSTANPSRATVNFTGNPSSDFASDEYLGIRNTLEVWITWNSSTLWLAWKGGNTNQSGDKYFFAIDVNPGTNNGTTNQFGGLQWTGASQNNLNKPDYAFLWTNQGSPLEYLGQGDNTNGWTGGSVDFTDYIVGGSPGVVEIGIPWANLGGSLPSSFSFWFWTNNSGEYYVWSAFPTDIPNGAGSQTADTRYFVANTSGDVSPNTLSSIPLPVELISFSVSLLDNSVNLNWRTETELNNYGFEIQKSEVRNQSTEWNIIGFVEGSGNSNSPKNFEFIDREIKPGKYSYRLKQIDNDGSYEYSNVIEIDLGMPGKFILSQNYPNPFNPTTKISYAIPQNSFVELKVFNMLGQEIATLVNQEKAAGFYEVDFNAVNQPSGIYFYRLQAGEFLITKKMLLLK